MLTSPTSTEVDSQDNHQTPMEDFMAYIQGVCVGFVHGSVSTIGFLIIYTLPDGMGQVKTYFFASNVGMKTHSPTTFM